MKKSFVLGMLLLLSSFMSAQSMRDIWTNMPDSLAPYLNKSLRTELADYVKMKAKPSVLNLLGDTTSVEKLTNDYLRARLTPSTVMEIKILDKNTIAVIKTWEGPADDSKLYIYTPRWEGKEAALPAVLEFAKPDSISATDYTDLQSMADPYLVKFKFDEKNNQILADYTFPLLNKADNKRVKGIIRKLSYRWDGNVFRRQ